MNNLPKRKTNRLPDFNYSSNGAYFITICVKDRRCILSNIVGADTLGSPLVNLTQYGKFVEFEILKTSNIYPDMKIEKFVIMPNHIHILLTIQNEENILSGAPRVSPPTNKLSVFVTALKKYTNKSIGKNIWQRGFHDHVVRNEQDFLAIWEYIDENPKKWLLGKDEYYI
jgi:REP element-mobilizing transposase RayT